MYSKTDVPAEAVAAIIYGGGWGVGVIQKILIHADNQQLLLIINSYCNCE